MPRRAAASFCGGRRREHGGACSPDPPQRSPVPLRLQNCCLASKLVLCLKTGASVHCFSFGLSSLAPETHSLALQACNGDGTPSDPTTPPDAHGSYLLCVHLHSTSHGTLDVHPPAFISAGLQSSASIAVRGFPLGAHNFYIQLSRFMSWDSPSGSVPCRVGVWGDLVALLGLDPVGGVCNFFPFCDFALSLGILGHRVCRSFL